MTGNNGKLDCQLVIEMIGRTWDRQFAPKPSQLDGPLKGAGGYGHVAIYGYIWLYGSYQPAPRGL